MVAGGKTPEVNARGYTQIMKEQLLKGEENEVRCFISDVECFFFLPRNFVSVAQENSGKGQGRHIESEQWGREERPKKEG